jgi:crotonobetainyl-CoA:carnitine CoA-transferase CaiB-like acyl-CoA transferase
VVLPCDSSTGPLAGYRVIEAARFVTGPYAAQMLADLGADVIKIEDPAGGDPFRGWGETQYGPVFQAFNRSKRSITLDLRDSRSLPVMAKLISSADVFIENFRPGVADRLGLGYEALSQQNQRLVYCSITGMGADGPYAQRPTYDIVGQGLSGLLGLLVDRHVPKPTGPTLSDTLTGVYAAYGTLAALHARERTGRGQLVSTSLLQATIGFMNEPFATLFGSGLAPAATDRPRASQVYAFLCADELPISIHLSSPPKFWQNLMRAVGREDMLADKRFDTHRNRQKHWTVIQAELAPIFRTKARAAWWEILVAEDVPAAPIYQLDEVLADEQVRHLDMIKTTTHPERGPVRVVGFPVTLNDTALGPISAPPTLGEHTNEILTEIGFGDDDILRMQSDGMLSAKGGPSNG